MTRINNYNKVLNTRNTPQTMPVAGKQQVENNAGGYVFTLDKWKRLERFLILGSDSGTFYATGAKLTKENADCVIACATEDMPRAIQMIVNISQAGKAANNDPALFALAVISTLPNGSWSIYNYNALTQVARTGTHILHFASMLDGMRGWGRAIRKAVSAWYNDKTSDALGFQMAKYQQRDGWAHADIIKLAHIAPTPDKDALFKWALNKPVDTDLLPMMPQTIRILNAQDTEEGVACIMGATKAPMELVPTQFKNSKLVWIHALPNLGLMAILRNLGNMSRYGVFEDDASLNLVVDKLTNVEFIHKSRLHPLAFAIALATYKQGRGMRGNGEWHVYDPISTAIEKGLMLSFDNVEPTNKRICIALDISSSMRHTNVCNSPFNAMEAEAILALVTMKSEKVSPDIFAFDHQYHAVNIKRNYSFMDAYNAVHTGTFGGTDCALPMLEAMKNGKEYDAFVIYTDNETWAGGTHPFQALQQYRSRMGINAKLVVVAMTSTGFTIADPSDAGMLDVVGLSTDTPAVIANFIKE